ncbi:MAG: DUF1353 domain-containing protein [Paraclostridium sp.]
MLRKDERFGELCLKVLGSFDGKTTYEVGRRFRCFLPLPDESEDIDYVMEVPVGFLTDLASVPKAFWSIVPPDGPYREAAVIHDFLYSGLKVPYPFDKLDRVGADKLFLYCMKKLDVPVHLRTTMYTMVRLFGAKYYRNKNK